MRLFIAVNFDKDTKDKIFDTVSNLKKFSQRGNFTLYENLHLTVVFIGETTRLETIKQVMDKIEAGRFNISLFDFGRFKRYGGDIYWLGIEKNNMLVSVYNQLYKMLVDEGFEIEKREFKPHLTLGREVLLKDDFNRDKFIKSIPKIDFDVKNISLMKSQRINGKLTYTEIYKKELV